MNEIEQRDRLRRQRNLAAVVAVLVLAGTMAISLPRVLRERSQLQAADTEIIRLQAAIAATNQQTRQVELEIGRIQAEIGATLQRR